MGFIDDLVKVALPVAAGAFLGPAASPLFTGATGFMAKPAVQSALLSGGIGLLAGQKPKDALKSALLGGIGGYAGQKFSAAGAPTTTGAGQTGGPNFPNTPPPGTVPTTPPPGTGSNVPLQGIKPKTMSAELLKGIGMSGDPGQENLLFKILNTQAGEGLLAGLGAYGLDKLMGDDEEEDNRGSFERRPYGAGGPGGKLGGITYAEYGGAMGFPPRDGGIDPNEGSGRSDDVPAMLTAGEFVMTRDAVKGAGNGNLRQGINNMYNMMSQFERMA